MKWEMSRPCRCVCDVARSLVAIFFFLMVGVWLLYVLVVILNVELYSQVNPKSEPPLIASLLAGQTQTELMNLNASTLKPMSGQS